MDAKRMLTVEEVAEILRLQTETVRQMARDSRIPGCKVGRVWRFDGSEIDNWLAERARNAAVTPQVRQAASADERVSEQQLLGLYEDSVSNGNGFRDPAFTENKHAPLHRWVPWIAGFSCNFVRDCLDRYLPSGGDPSKLTVLDPFAGVGTTLVEAIRRGHVAFGFEINPYAALATRAKIECCDISLSSLERWVEQFSHHMRLVANEDAPPPNDVRPAGFRSRIPFYSPDVEPQVLHALDFIRSIRDGSIKDLFLVAFGSVMVRFSNYSYEPSLASRPGSGKQLIEQADVRGVIESKLREILTDVRRFQSEMEHLGMPVRGEVFPDSIFRWQMYLKPGATDVVITSPPYLNNYHYIRNTRPQLFWLEFIGASDQLKQIELESFGKFWQTVRDGPRIELAFDMPELEAVLDRVRAMNPDKGTYGGAGWANYATTYFNDTFRFCEVLAGLLKPGGHAVIVIGNSILQGIELRTDEYLARIGELCGLERTAIYRLRDKRVGSSIVSSAVRSAHKGSMPAKLYEVAVVLRKPD